MAGCKHSTRLHHRFDHQEHTKNLIRISKVSFENSIVQMVCGDGDFAACDHRPEVVEGFDDHQELSLSSNPILLSLAQALGKEAQWPNIQSRPPLGSQSQGVNVLFALLVVAQDRVSRFDLTLDGSILVTFCFSLQLVVSLHNHVFGAPR